MTNTIQLFPEVTSETHPAVIYVTKFLDAQKQKNINAFANSFNENMQLFANLPGGVIIRDPKQLIARHKQLYESPNFHVEYGDIGDGLGNDDFFACSVQVKVTLPDNSQRTNYIDMTFVRNGNEWVPARLINTVVAP